MSRKEQTSPTSDAKSPLAAVTALMEERRTFESWLAALEARRDSTPEKVFTRVHADYTARLEAVVEQLTSHAGGLRAQHDKLTARLTAIQEARQAAVDERAEAELRNHVGELTGSAWTRTQKASDERLAALSTEQADVERELARTVEMIADAERPTPSRAAPAVPASPVSPAAPSAPTARADAEPAGVSDQAEMALHVPSTEEPEPPASLPTRGSKGFDELAFLQSVVETPAPLIDTPVTPPPPPAIDPTPRPRRDAYAARQPEDRIVNLDATADEALVKSSGTKPLGANVSGNHPLVIKQKSAEGSRTLKCAECGAMNYPTEWYCERCGAELASL